MQYKFDDFLQIVKRSAVVEFIMTKDPLFYENINEDKVKFCKDREISTLPSNDGINLYELNENNFIKREIKDFEKLKITDFIFDKQVMNNFDKSYIKYIFDNEKIVGVLHFCDYNRKAVYIYLYGLINELEEKLREILLNKNFSEEDFLEYHKIKSEKSKNEYYEGMLKRYNDSKFKLKDFQFADLFHLIMFCNSKLKLGIDDTISKLRNDIAHSKLLIKTKDRTEKLEAFDYESFKDFRNKVDLLFKALERINSEKRKTY